MLTITPTLILISQMEKQSQTHRRTVRAALFMQQPAERTTKLKYGEVRTRRRQRRHVRASHSQPMTFLDPTCPVMHMGFKPANATHTHDISNAILDILRVLLIKIIGTQCIIIFCLTQLFTDYVSSLISLTSVQKMHKQSSTEGLGRQQPQPPAKRGRSRPSRAEPSPPSAPAPLYVPSSRAGSDTMSMLGHDIFNVSLTHVLILYGTHRYKDDPLWGRFMTDLHSRGNMTLLHAQYLNERHIKDLSRTMTRDELHCLALDTQGGTSRHAAKQALNFEYFKLYGKVKGHRLVAITAIDSARLSTHIPETLRHELAMVPAASKFDYLPGILYFAPGLTGFNKANLATIYAFYNGAPIIVLELNLDPREDLSWDKDPSLPPHNLIYMPLGMKIRFLKTYRPATKTTPNRPMFGSSLQKKHSSGRPKTTHPSLSPECSSRSIWETSARTIPIKAKHTTASSWMAARRIPSQTVSICTCCWAESLHTPGCTCLKKSI